MREIGLPSISNFAEEFQGSQEAKISESPMVDVQQSHDSYGNKWAVTNSGSEQLFTFLLPKALQYFILHIDFDQ